MALQSRQLSGWPAHYDKRPGSIAIRRGIDTAFTDSIEFIVKGMGGHAARPHETSDAVLMAALSLKNIDNAHRAA